MASDEIGSRSGWIVCQIGARENYAIARALLRRERLAGVITDAWVEPNSAFSVMLPRRFKERWHPELCRANVRAPSIISAFRWGGDKLARRTGWAEIMARNAWFQRTAARKLRKFSGRAQTVFSYSYAAGDIFAEAKRRGWRTVLGQIDPGPVEARLVAKLYESADQRHAYESMPQKYWSLWRREIELADKIVVNSAWSRDALVAEGIAIDKIAIIPLAHEGSGKAPPKHLPTTFTPERPLRLLFLGQVTLRKGIGSIFEVMLMLPDAPITLDIVGPLQIEVPKAIADDPRITFHGPVARSETRAFYESADVFLFPTYSDGFGLTQLEALAAGLPVLASRFCGDVIREGINGHILKSLEPAELAGLVRNLAANPPLVANLQDAAMVELHRFGLDAIGRQLEGLFL